MNHRPTHQEVTEAVQSILYEFSRERSDIGTSDPVGINSGYCRWFADEVLDYLNDPDAVVRYDAAYIHTWLEFDGQHYDAEHPEGVEDPHQFPIWSRVTEQELEMAAEDCEALTLAVLKDGEE